MSDSHENENEAYDRLVRDIKPLAAEIKRLQAQLKAAGMFCDDRELLDCPQCKLEEDVTFAGRLITTRSGSRDADTALRFQPVDDRETWWRCPACGTEFRGGDIAE